MPLELRRSWQRSAVLPTNDLAISGEGSVQLDSNFQVDLAVQIDGYMPTGARHLMRAQYIPDDATSVRYDLGEFV